MESSGGGSTRKPILSKIEGYADRVRSNPLAARGVEQLLQYSGFLVPAALFPDRELAAEGGYCVSSLLAVLHDLILTGGAGRWKETQQLLQGSNSAPRSPLWMKRLEQLRLALTVLKQIEVIVEKVGLKVGGQRGRRKLITLLELIKAVCRLFILMKTKEMIKGGGHTVSPPLDEGQQPLAAKRPRGGRWGGERSLAPVSGGGGTVYHGKRSGVCFSLPIRSVGDSVEPKDSPASQSREGNGQQQQQQQEEEEEEEEEEVEEAGKGGVDSHTASRFGKLDSPRGAVWMYTGEILHIARPVVYSQCCAQFGERSWLAWGISLSMDVLSAHCTSTSLNSSSRFESAREAVFPDDAGAESGHQGMVALRRGAAGVAARTDGRRSAEQAELQRRKMMWLFYLLRSPLFDRSLRPVAAGVAGLFEGIPLFDSGSKYALKMLLYLHRHHFYTSAS